MIKGDWAQMNFDPDVLVDVRSLIRVMRGEVATLTKDQWEDAKECCADVMEQFLEQGNRVLDLENALRLCNEELIKAYEQGSQYQEQAADLSAQLMEMRRAGN